MPRYKTNVNGTVQAVDPSSANTTLIQQGNATVSITAAAGPMIIKNTGGYISGALCTATGSAALLFYDNAIASATGTVIGIIPAAATVGQYFPLDMPAMQGIVAATTASTPVVTLSYA